MTGSQTDRISTPRHRVVVTLLHLIAKPLFDRSLAEDSDEIRGSPLLGAMTRARIAWRVVRTWRKRDGYFEQELKRKGLADLCPACNGKGRR